MSGTFATYGFFIVSVLVMGVALSLAIWLAWPAIIRSSAKSRASVHIFAAVVRGGALTMVIATGIALLYLSLTTANVVRPDRQFASARKAIVLLHGIHSNIDTWDTFSRTLISDDGLRHVNIYRIGYAAENGNLDMIAETVSELLGRMSARYDEISVIAHSLGGLVARRAALRVNANGTGRVSLLITYGSPLNGSATAGFSGAIGLSDLLAAELMPGSEAIRRHSDFWRTSAVKPRHVCIASKHDALVPFDSAVHLCDQAVEMSGYGHTDLIRPKGASDQRYRAARSALDGTP